MARLNLTRIDHLRNLGWTVRWRLRPARRLVERQGDLAIVEVGEASREAGALFQKTFRAVIPPAPRHFILVDARTPSAPALAYVHYARCGEAWLAGGLVSDANRFRTLDHANADVVRANGGFAEWLMRASCAALSDRAVFARIGDKRSETVNRRAGFLPTGHPHLWMLWKGEADAAAQEALIRRVLAVGAF